MSMFWFAAHAEKVWSCDGFVWVLTGFGPLLTAHVQRFGDRAAVGFQPALGAEQNASLRLMARMNGLLRNILSALGEIEQRSIKMYKKFRK